MKSLPDLEIHEGQANPDLELNIDEDLNTPLKVACSDTMSELSDMQEIYDEASDRSEPQRDISQAVTDAKLEAKKIALKKVLNEDEVLLDVNRPTSLIGAFTGDDNHNNPKAPDSNFSDERHRVDLSLPCPPWNITRTGASNLSLIVMDKFIIDHLQLLRDFVESSRMAEIPLDKSFKYTTLEDTKKFIKRSAASRFQK